MKTRMLNTHGTCPYCGATISLSYVEKEWKYGSPIRTCKKCKKITLTEDIMKLQSRELHQIHFL